MPDDGNGNYSLPSGYLAVTGQKVLPSNHNPPLEDLGQSMTARLPRDGRAPLLGNINANSFKFTGLGDGTDAGDSINKGQLDAATANIDDDIDFHAAKISTKSGNYTAVKDDNATSFRFTAGATLSFIQADDSDENTPGLGENWTCEVWATNGVVILDPDGSETINGAATLRIQTGQKARVFCTGTAFFAIVTSDSYSGPQLQGYVYGLGMSTNSTDATNDIDFASGAAASDTAPFHLMQFSAMTKRLDAAWVAGNNEGMLDTGSVGNNTYYLWGIERSDTLETDFLASLSNSAPTMPANYDRKRVLGSLIRTSGSNGPVSSIVRNIRSGAVATPSGSSFLYTGIPAGVSRFTVHLRSIAFSAASQPILRVGPSGGVVSTGYDTTTGTIVSGNSTTITSTTSAVLDSGAAAVSSNLNADIVFTRVPGRNDWSFTATCTAAPSGRVTQAKGTISITGDIDRFQLTTTAGTATMSGSGIWADWEV